MLVRCHQGERISLRWNETDLPKLLPAEATKTKDACALLSVTSMRNLVRFLKAEKQPTGGAQ